MASSQVDGLLLRFIIIIYYYDFHHHYYCYYSYYYYCCYDIIITVIYIRVNIPILHSFCLEWEIHEYSKSD